MVVEEGSYLTNEVRLVQVMAVEETKFNGTIYICEDVAASADEAADIVRVSSRQIKYDEWKEVKRGERVAEAQAS